MRSALRRKVAGMLASLVDPPLGAAVPPRIGRLGPFVVALDGTLWPADPAIAPGFGFRWRGRRVAARLLPEHKVGFSVLAARVPFTAEDAASRPRVLATAAAMREALPEAWRLALTPDHAIRLTAETDLELPPTATRLVTAATLFVLALDPLIDALEDAGARPA